MKHLFYNIIKVILCVLVISIGRAFAQDATPTDQKVKQEGGLIEISGRIKDNETGEELIGVTVSVKGTVATTATDNKGNFKLRTSQKLPFKLVISGLGYTSQEYEINENTKSLLIALNQESVLSDEVVVSASRVEESQLKSPVAIEKLDIRSIRETAAPSFYDALENVKGVQMITSSLTFKVPNARGFNAPNNFRFMQLVDGVDMQSATLGVPLGNAIGPTELDIESVEITPGASSALYGMNALNGMANMKTKSPFLYQGLSVYQKTGVNHVDDKSTSGFGPKPLTETAIRYAKAINNRLAFKINASYLKGTDWVANTQTDANPLVGGPNAATSDAGIISQLGGTNPAADNWNTYGNEASTGSNIANVNVLYNGKSQAFKVARTGYQEKDLANYNVQNIKADASLHYRITDKLELSYGYRYGQMDGVFQRGNRIQLNGATVQSHKLELSSKNFTLRTYMLVENTGNSYNMKPLADNLDINRFNGAKNQSTADWGTAFQTQLQNDINNGVNLSAAFADARNVADAGRPDPNTNSAQFNAIKNQITGINNWDIGALIPGAPATGGAALKQQSRTYHSEFQYNLSDITGKYLDVLIGADFRVYDVIPDGNNFVDFSRPLDQRNQPGGKDIFYTKYGGFVQGTKKFFEEKLKIVGSVRVDHNTAFNPVVNPRLAVVYTLAQTHNFRASVQNGYRYPSLFEALSFVNNGSVRRVGGLPGVNNGLGFNENSFFRSSVDAYQTAVNTATNAGQNRTQAALANKGLLVPANLSPMRPEQITAFEIGYKSIFFDNRFVVDADAYYNIYDGFLGQVEVNVPTSGKVGSDETALDALNNQNLTRYRVYTNSKNIYNSLGAGLSVTYNFFQKYTLGGNLNFNTLTAASTAASKNDYFITAFNTPKWSTNISFGNREVIKNLGFNLTYHWQAGYSWQSQLVNGEIPAYWTLDGQVTYKIPALLSTVKVGATNLLNKQYIQYAAGPTIGGFYYVAITVDGLFNKIKN
jgi:iron complex outermembrane receptor protein